MAEKVKKNTFLKWPFCGDYDYEINDGYVVSVTCKYCPLIEGEKLKREGQQRGLLSVCQSAM